MTDVMRSRIRLICGLLADAECADSGPRTVMAAWFIEHPEDAKKMYMTMVIAIDPRYMDRVEPISKTFQAPESVVSTFSRQYSAQVCARSTNKTSPSSRKRTAPTSAT